MRLPHCQGMHPLTHEGSWHRVPVSGDILSVCMGLWLLLWGWGGVAQILCTTWNLRRPSTWAKSGNGLDSATATSTATARGPSSCHCCWCCVQRLTLKLQPRSMPAPCPPCLLLRHTLLTSPPIASAFIICSCISSCVARIHSYSCIS